VRELPWPHQAGPACGTQLAEPRDLLVGDRPLDVTRPALPRLGTERHGAAVQVDILPPELPVRAAPLARFPAGPEEGRPPEPPRQARHGAIEGPGGADQGGHLLEAVGPRYPLGCPERRQRRELVDEPTPGCVVPQRDDVHAVLEGCGRRHLGPPGGDELLHRQGLQIRQDRITAKNLGPPGQAEPKLYVRLRLQKPQRRVLLIEQIDEAHGTILQGSIRARLAHACPSLA